MLLIAGTGDMYGEMGQKIDDLGLNDVIMRLGYRNDTADLLESSDMFVTPKEVDLLCDRISEILSSALNRFLQPEIEEDIIAQLV